MKRDSQGLCFIGRASLRELIQAYYKPNPGLILEYETLKELGEHKGASVFTIGQREGLGLAGGPWFIKEIDIQNNQVFVVNGLKQKLLETDIVKIEDINWLDNPRDEIEIEAQIRYRQQPTKAILKLDKVNTGLVKFQKPVKAVAPGQSLVFYQGNLMLGSGFMV